MDPPDFALTGFEEETDTVILHPATGRGTFRTSRTASLLDYFLVSSRTATAVDNVQALEATGIKGHTPVRLTFKPKATTVRALQLRRPPRLRAERVYGPLLPPPDWSAAAAAAEAALEAARRRQTDTQQLLDEAYRQWADLAEIELADRSGQPPKKFGERGRLPRFVWRSVLPEVAPKFGKPYAATAAWINTVLNEVRRIADAVDFTPTQDDLYDDAGDDPMPQPGPRHDGRMDRRAEEVRRARARRPPTRPATCARTLREIISSLDADFPDIGHGPEVLVLQSCRDRLCDFASRLLHDLEWADQGQYRGDGGAERNDGELLRGRLRAISDGLNGLHDEVSQLEARHTTELGADEKKQWNEWIAEGIDRGAARAHAYTRLPTAWAPTVANLPDGDVSAAIDDLLDDQRRKYKALWRPSERPFRYAWTVDDELPRMTPHRLKEVAGSFSSRTSTTYDGFHPRELGHLSEEALGALATIFATAEVAAIWPRQVSLIVAALLPKPKGGYRPIGMAPAVYRLWSKARRVEADEWERQHARPFFSACKGNGPVDTVWRLATKQECGAARGDVAATISEDIHAFFETVDRDRLVAEARALGFPLAILRAALAEYSAARVVSMQGRVGRELYPTVGVVAGCSLAMVLTKVYCLRAMDRFVSTAPRSVHLDTFVDDLVISTIGKPNAVIDDLECAHGLLRDMVNDDLGCQLAPGKAAATSTTRTVAAALGRKIGIGTGVATVITILGVDNTAAAPRAALRRRSKKAARLRAAMARRRRLQQVQRAVGQRAKKIFVTGLQPQAAYGSAIWGMDEGEALKLRRLAAASLRPHGRCRSLHTTLLWHGAPTAAAEVAPLLQMARMVWQAVTRRSDAEARGATIADLRQWWEEAMAHADPLVKRMEAAMKDADDRGEDISVAISRKIWSGVRGPVAAMALTATRLRWKIVGPFVLHDQWGAEHLLTNTSPAMLKKLATDAVRFDLEQKMRKGGQ